MITRPVGPLQTNFYLVFDSDSGAGIVIDPGAEPGLILDTAVQAGAQVKAIMITHGHHDHIAATAEVARQTGAPVYGSAEAGMVMADPERFRLFPGMPKVPPFTQIIELKGGEEFTFGPLSVKAIATPGHSLGSITYFTCGSLFCGDLLFHGSVGRTDLPGGSFEQLAASVKRLVLEFPPDTPVYPGHGNATNLRQEKESNPFLTDLGW